MAGTTHTCALRQHAAEKLRCWHDIISATYFPLHLQLPDAAHFCGDLSRSRLGALSLSRLRSGPALYERRREHLHDVREAQFLITLPRKKTVSFSQGGKEVRCAPGQFVIQRGDEPYRFAYRDANELLVLKVQRSALAERIAQPERFCASAFDTRSGSARLFAAMLLHAQREISATPAWPATDIIARQLLELLTLSLEERRLDNKSGSGAKHSPAREAHLQRIERYIRAHLGDNKLTPASIACACGISRRYLHNLFSDLGTTVSRQIREQRLVAARDYLRLCAGANIAETAYRFGFGDQAQFSRQFRHRFGLTPSAWRQHDQARDTATQQTPPLAS